MSHHQPSISLPTLRRRASRRTRARSGFAIAVAVAMSGACGSGGGPSDSLSAASVVREATSESADASDAAAPNGDAGTGAEVADEDDRSAGGSDDAAADGPTTAADDQGARSDPAEDGGSPDPDPAADRPDPDPAADEPGADRPTEHPLERVVIESAVVDAEASPVLDEAASLACANTEFAMDALIEGSPDRAERFDAAAEWAEQSDHAPIRAFAQRLAADPRGAAANDLVVEILEACAAGGYEL